MIFQTKRARYGPWSFGPKNLGFGPWSFGPEKSGMVHWSFEPEKPGLDHMVIRTEFDLVSSLEDGPNSTFHGCLYQENSRLDHGPYVRIGTIDCLWKMFRT
jgi:hypothetical protein